MRTLAVDKVASVAMAFGGQREVRVSDDYLCQPGDLVAVKVLTNKTTYNTVELTTGRMSPLRQGDILVGALGHRNALFGYAGVVPSKLKTGDTVQILNMGGVIGQCTATSPTLGWPFDCEILGQVLSFPDFGKRTGVPANIRDNALPIHQTLPAKMPPVVAVVGSCMNCGKTEACQALVHQFVHRGLTVAAGKTTGVSLRRDILAMEDAGAHRTLCFTDFGAVTTGPDDAADLARSILATLAEDEPDVIVLELGDGLIGAYGVDAILKDEAIRNSFQSVVLAANDPVAAWGGVQILKDRFGVHPSVITGPATDNVAGTKLIEKETNVRSLNARTEPADFAEAAMPVGLRVAHG